MFPFICIYSKTILFFLLAQKKLSFDNGDSRPIPRSEDQDKGVKKEKGTSLKRKADPREGSYLYI